ncbi:MAG: serine/threonine protein kinase [Sandaracinaceae bacterium]|nr:serine/threonine protein kinase [Sandaracinaceae bacterium]
MRPPFDPAQYPPGTVVGGKYQLGSMIGFGEHSVVFAATHRFLQRKAAVKVFAQAAEAKQMARIAREARLAGSLRHPNIVEIYEVGALPDHRPFLVMELLEGETLEQRVERVGPLPVAQALAIAQQVLHGLAIAHEQKIVHRDLRPPNLFLARVRGEEVCKILDFGTARQFDNPQDTWTAPGTSLTHAAYFAPEQLVVNALVDHRADLYATGMVLYVLLTGRVPFAAKAAAVLTEVMNAAPPPPSTWRPELPRDVDRVVLAALSKRPEDRFQTAEDMAEALRLASLFADYVTGERTRE